MTVGEEFIEIQNKMNTLSASLGLDTREIITLSDATLPMLEEKLKPHIKPCGMCYYEANRTDGDMNGVGCSA